MAASDNDFTIGNDVRLVLIFGILGRIDLAHITGFSAKQIVKQLRVPVLNAPPIGRDVPGGWNGTFDLDRANSAADDLASAVETLFWNGQRLPAGQIYQYVNEPDGSTSTYLFSGATLSVEDAGTWQQEQTVKQRLSFFASRRRRI